MRRTRILATIGPASDRPDTIHAMIAAGVDAVRLNFSHGSASAHAAVCALVRRAAAESGRATAILQDLSGPKIRIGALRQPLDLSPGDPLTIALAADDGGRTDTADAHTVTCSFDALFTSVAAGARLLLDDGRIELEVVSVSPARLGTRVAVGGRLDSHKGINVPGSVMKTSALTSKDLSDLRVGLSMGVDAIAVSFVQSAEDLRQARAAATAAGAPDVPIIAKIERPQAVDRIDDILDEADGLMVARGDLGIEVPLEAVPAIQKRLVLAARDRGVPVVVATQVLESMRESPRPTRAEVTDAAHAVDEGADAVMLAGETAIGRYPVQTVQTLDRILRAAEQETLPAAPLTFARAGWLAHGRALCEAAVALASRASAEAIVAVTEGGRTARMLSSLRPRARILAATPSAQTAQRLSFCWGVTPLVIPSPMLADLRDLLRARQLVPPGSAVVFVSMDATLAKTDANFVHVETL